MYTENKKVKNAVKWISDKRQEDPAEKLNKLIDRAIFRFDLSPGDAEFLLQFYRENSGDTNQK